MTTPEKPGIAAIKEFLNCPYMSWTQGELAEAMDVSRISVHRWINGDCQPDVESIKRILFWSGNLSTSRATLNVLLKGLCPPNLPEIKRVVGGLKALRFEDFY